MMQRTRIAAIAAALAVALPAFAQTAPESTTASARLSDSYSTWAGSPANADKLVQGLRSGSDIRLGDTTISNPARPMGYGNVRIALNLARAQLAAAGIENPTARQIDASLTGGEVTNTAGTTTRMQSILDMRADGMGWGRIANDLGFRLGSVMSGKAPAASAGSATTVAGAASAVSTHGKAHAYGQGIVTATGQPIGRGHSVDAQNAVKAGSTGATSASGAGNGQLASHGKSGK